MSEPLKLFHGINSSHEFWQDEAANWIILRCHHEATWSIIQNRAFRLQRSDHLQHYGWSDSANEAVKKLSVHAELSRDFEYQKIGDKYHLVAPVSVDADQITI